MDRCFTTWTRSITSTRSLCHLLGFTVDDVPLHSAFTRALGPGFSRLRRQPQQPRLHRHVRPATPWHFHFAVPPAAVQGQLLVHFIATRFGPCVSTTAPQLSFPLQTCSFSTVPGHRLLRSRHVLPLDELTRDDFFDELVNRNNFPPTHTFFCLRALQDGLSKLLEDRYTS